MSLMLDSRPSNVTVNDICKQNNFIGEKINTFNIIKYADYL